MNTDSGIITSLQNSKIKHIQQLMSHSKTRRSAKEMVLEGVHLLESALLQGCVPKMVCVSLSRQAHPDVQKILAMLAPNTIVLVSDAVAEKISSLSNANDIISVLPMPVMGSWPDSADCVVLDAIQDPGNMGTILRSAAATGIKHVVLGEGCVDVYSPKVLRSGMGAHFLLSLYDQVPLHDFLHIYQSHIRATSLNAQNSASLYSLDLRTPSAWVFGNEGQGVHPSLLALVKTGVLIPMLGSVESLNVAMASTVCLFEQMRQRME